MEKHQLQQLTIEDRMTVNSHLSSLRKLILIAKVISSVL